MYNYEIIVTVSFLFFLKQKEWVHSKNTKITSESHNKSLAILRGFVHK